MRKNGERRDIDAQEGTSRRHGGRSNTKKYQNIKVVNLKIIKKIDANHTFSEEGHKWVQQTQSYVQACISKIGVKEYLRYARLELEGEWKARKENNGMGKEGGGQEEEEKRDKGRYNVSFAAAAFSPSLENTCLLISK